MTDQETPSLPFKGPRVTLRDFLMDDQDSVSAYASDPMVTRYLVFAPQTPEETEQFLMATVSGAQYEGHRHHFELGAIDETGVLIGGARITIRSHTHQVGDIGYVINRGHWGKGYGTEVARLLIQFGFHQLHLHRIYATAHPDNVGSHRVLEKSGMRYEGYIREHLWIDGKRRDSLLFAILATDMRCDGVPDLK